MNLLRLHLPILLGFFLLPCAATATDFAYGADVSWLSQMESSGKVFHDSTGNVQDLLDILKQYGVNSIRLRTWVNPSDGWCGKSDLVKMAMRAHAKGLRVMVDFHYSDSWTDPGKQTKPSAWTSYTQDQLAQAVRTYTVDVLTALKDSGVVPEWAQVGNETNDGMLWPANSGDPGGRITVNGAAKFAALVQSGSQAVKSVDPTTQVVVHVADGWDNALFRWVFDSLKSNGTSWDVVGMSIYPDSTNWRTQASQVLANMKDMVSRYGKKVVVSEVGFAMSQSDTSYNLLKLLVANAKSVSNGAGLGVFYWEPEAYCGWQSYQLGAFDDSGKPTRALRAFQEASGITSNATSRRSSDTFWEPRATEIVWHGDAAAAYRIADLSGATLERGKASPGMAVGKSLPRGSYAIWTPTAAFLWTRF